MRFFPPLPRAAFPPFLPISRITLDIRSRFIASSYVERPLLATFWVLTRAVGPEILYATCASGIRGSARGSCLIESERDAPVLEHRTRP
jgi:hypothetical protein